MWKVAGLNKWGNNSFEFICRSLLGMRFWGSQCQGGGTLAVVRPVVQTVTAWREVRPASSEESPQGLPDWWEALDSDMVGFLFGPLSLPGSYRKIGLDNVYALARTPSPVDWCLSTRSPPLSLLHLQIGHFVSKYH